MKFTMRFGKYIGKHIRITDKGESMDGETVGARYYSGKFGGVVFRNGLCFIVDNEVVKIGTDTEIEFSDY